MGRQAFLMLVCRKNQVQTVMEIVLEQTTARWFVMTVVHAVMSSMPLKYWFLVFDPFYSSKSKLNFILFLLKFE